MRPLDIIGFGEVLVLLQAPQAESLGATHQLEVHVAGAEFNACAAASALGATTSLCTRIGTDPLAEHIVSRASALGVGLLALQDPVRPTGLFFKDVKPDGERRVYYYRSTSAAGFMDAIDAQRGLQTLPRAVLLSGLTAALGDGPRAMFRRVFELARESSIRTALDVNLRPQLGRLSDSIESVRSVLPDVEFLMIGVEDARSIFGVSDPTLIAIAAHAAGCKEIVVTDGANGSWWQDETGKMNHQPTTATTVLDPVGAGDAFAGSYLAARLMGLGTRASSWLGSEFAAAVIACQGDTDGLPSADRAGELLAIARKFDGAVL